MTEDEARRAKWTVLCVDPWGRVCDRVTVVGLDAARQAEERMAVEYPWRVRMVPA